MFSSIFKVPKEMKAIIISDQKEINPPVQTTEQKTERKKSVRIREMTKHIRRIKANNIYYNNDWHKYVQLREES